MNIFGSIKFIGYHIDPIFKGKGNIEEYALYGKTSERTKIFICNTKTRDACVYIISALTQYEPLELKTGVKNLIPEKLKLGCRNCVAIVNWYEELLERKRQAISRLGLELKELYNKLKG